MAEVRAFRGIRYDESKIGSLSRVVCAPYDIITPAAQAACYSRNLHNAVRLELASDQPGDSENSNRYTRAASALGSWLSSGALVRDDSPGMYVYEETFVVDGRSHHRRGVFTVVRLAEWSDRVVLPHERTMAKPKADRMALLKATRTNLSPILALYEDPTETIRAALDSVMSQPPTTAFGLETDDVAAAASLHRLWRVVEPAVVESISGVLADHPIFIADGHHRYTTALDYWHERQSAGAAPDDPASFIMMLLLDVDDPGLVVLPTHRLVRSPALDRTAALAALSETFDVESVPIRPASTNEAARIIDLLARRGGRHAFALVGLAPGFAHLIVARRSGGLDALLPSDRSSAWRQLDVAVLHSAVLNAALGLSGEEQGDGQQLAYTRDAAEALAAVASGACDVACLLNPTRVDQIRDVALDNDVMPEKSTYFWPKPPTGLVFYSHE